MKKGYFILWAIMYVGLLIPNGAYSQSDENENRAPAAEDKSDNSEAFDSGEGEVEDLYDKFDTQETSRMNAKKEKEKIPEARHVVAPRAQEPWVLGPLTFTVIVFTNSPGAKMSVPLAGWKSMPLEAVMPSVL